MCQSRAEIYIYETQDARNATGWAFRLEFRPCMEAVHETVDNGYTKPTIPIAIGIRTSITRAIIAALWNLQEKCDEMLDYAKERPWGTLDLLYGEATNLYKVGRLLPDDCYPKGQYDVTVNIHNLTNVKYDFGKFYTQDDCQVAFALNQYTQVSYEDSPSTAFQDKRKELAERCDKALYKDGFIARFDDSDFDADPESYSFIDKGAVKLYRFIYDTHPELIDGSKL